jgi:hypothetical protein
MFPTDLVVRVLAHCDLDTRIAFKVKPNRLDTKDYPDWRTHDGLVYIRATKSLFNFISQTVSWPIELDIECDGLIIFNLYEQTYTCTHNGGGGMYFSKEPWATDLKVLIK